MRIKQYCRTRPTDEAGEAADRDVCLLHRPHSCALSSCSAASAATATTLSLPLRSRTTTDTEKLNFDGLETTPAKRGEMPFGTIGTPFPAKPQEECWAGGVGS
jgi:hypothetical protein